jgi:hypothetical protein
MFADGRRWEVELLTTSTTSASQWEFCSEPIGVPKRLRGATKGPGFDSPAALGEAKSNEIGVPAATGRCAGVAEAV